MLLIYRQPSTNLTTRTLGLWRQRTLEMCWGKFGVLHRIFFSCRVLGINPTKEELQDLTIQIDPNVSGFLKLPDLLDMMSRWVSSQISQLTWCPQDYYGEKLRCANRGCIQVFHTTRLQMTWSFIPPPSPVTLNLYLWLLDPIYCNPKNPPWTALCILSGLSFQATFTPVRAKTPIPPTTMKGPSRTLLSSPKRPLITPHKAPSNLSLFDGLISSYICRCFDKNGIGSIPRQELHSIFEVGVLIAAL